MNPVYVALDTTDPAYARTLAECVRMSVGGLKLGLEFFNAHGPDGVRPFLDMGLPVFLDLKYHDIPNTVAGAGRAVLRLSWCPSFSCGGVAYFLVSVRPITAADDPGRAAREIAQSLG